MNFPKRMRSAGQTWRVTRPRKIIDDDGDECDGRIYPDRRVIAIQRGLAADAAAETFLHELIHVCSAQARTKLGSRAEEDFVRAVSPFLLGAIRDNRLDFG